MGTDIYYTAPSDETFEDIKRAAIKIWQTYDDSYGYASEKINSIKDLDNVKDNYMYMVSMFDSDNQAKLMSMVHPETASRIVNAMA